MTDHQTARRLAALDQVLILTHRRPDGDTIGCASALCLALRQLGKTAWVLPNEDAHGLFTPIWRGSWPRRGFCPSMLWRWMWHPWACSLTAPGPTRTGSTW